MAFRLLSPRGTFAEMGDGGVEGINSVYYKIGETLGVSPIGAADGDPPRRWAALH
jgi:hypothetical protein